MGEGEIEHRRLQPGRLIEDEIRFAKPFKSKSLVSFDLEDQGGRSKVTWHMQGSLPWFLFWMRSKMEIFTGMDYERGLRMLKEWLETGQILSKTEIVGIENVGLLRMAGVRRISAAIEIGSKMDTAFAELAQELERLGLPRGREAICVYHRFDLKSQEFDFTAGYVLCESQADLPARVATWSLPTCRALRVNHVGSYRQFPLSQGHDALVGNRAIGAGQWPTSHRFRKTVFRGIIDLAGECSQEDEEKHETQDFPRQRFGWGRGDGQPGEGRQAGEGRYPPTCFWQDGREVDDRRPGRGAVWDDHVRRSESRHAASL